MERFGARSLSEGKEEGGGGLFIKPLLARSAQVLPTKETLPSLSETASDHCGSG